MRIQMPAFPCFRMGANKGIDKLKTNIGPEWLFENCMMREIMCEIKTKQNSNKTKYDKINNEKNRVFQNIKQIIYFPKSVRFNFCLILIFIADFSQPYCSTNDSSIATNFTPCYGLFGCSLS